ncbi:MAG TPA: hypothetical protein VIG49_07295 [Acetobacteraceae bacterium]
MIVPTIMAWDIIVIGGPNGAGKTTAASVLLPDHVGVLEFVNADNIALGVSERFKLPRGSQVQGPTPDDGLHATKIPR